MKIIWRDKWVLLMFFILIGCQDRHTLFVEMPPTQTGIDFVNQLTYSDSLTVLEFEYMYNGAGVAIGDLNNDGLQDIFFTANMTSNRLYVNQGGWQFEDHTEPSGLQSRGWSNGACMIDINQDGFLDIYVSRGGPRGTPSELRANLLYINNGDLTFTESAASYGLNNDEYSVQAAFLDYDRDGDLDVYLLSNALVSFNRNTSRPKETTGKAPSVDKLFMNNGDDTFTEVSEEAGILIEGFGLGVSICDINEDLWPDIYVSNDFLTDDLLYINQGDGTFENRASQYLKHQTYNGMGNDVADYNNDGKEDIVVLDMLPEDNRRRKLTMMGNNYDEFQNNLHYGYQPQYIRNTLQLNNGDGTFSEIGQLAGIDATDWSWSALLADYDNDGLKDLLVTNGYRQDVTNLDFIVYGQQTSTMGEAEANKKLRLKALDDLPGTEVPNYIYRNKGDLTFENMTAIWGLDKPTYSNGGAYADLDNDGDLDLVINNIDQPALLYRNTVREKKANSHYLRIKLKGSFKNRQGLGSKIYLTTKGSQQYQYYSPYRGYISFVDPVLHFGLDSVDKVEKLLVIWPDGRMQELNDLQANQTITLDYADASKANSFTRAVGDSPPVFQEVTGKNGFDYRHQENLFVDFKVQATLPHMHSVNGPGVTVGDINGDGTDDIFLGGAMGYPGWFYFQDQHQATFSSSKMPIDSAFEDLGALLLDVDLDGDHDLYITSGGSSQQPLSPLYQDRLYLNDGEGNFKPSQALPELRQSTGTVVATDYDLDGDLDLFVGGRVLPGSYPLPPESHLLRNTLKERGELKFEKVLNDMPHEWPLLGMVTAALWTDINQDEWPDLMLTGEFMTIRIFLNQKGKLVEITEASGLQHQHGWWNSITAGDFDKDGDMDYLLGNLGQNHRFRVSREEPLCVYASDFDKNGRIDPIMCYYVQGKNYIAHTRDDVIDQINAMRARFKTYGEYAETTFEKSFLPSELQDAYVVHSENFSSSYLENLGDGEFRLEALPLRVQFAPIYGMVVDDFDEDGNLDALMVGNSYAPEVSTGRYDALTGIFLAGNGRGEFEVKDSGYSGFSAHSDAKGMAQLLESQGRPLVVVTNNDDKAQMFISGKESAVYRANSRDAYADVLFKDGTSYRHEFYYGSTYLSNSGRFIRISEEIAEITVVDFDGNRKSVKP